MPYIINKLNKYKEEIKKLKKEDKTLIVADHDDTLFSREEQLEKEILLRENRWAKWNEVMKKHLGFEYMIQKYYEWKKWPPHIREKLRPNYDLILTAWIEEFQLMRLESTWLDHINIVVTPTAEEKIEALIKYITEELKHIPKKIEIYEDRPQYFEKYREIMEKLLWTKIDIYFVEMDWNRWYKKIEKV